MPASESAAEIQTEPLREQQSHGSPHGPPHARRPDTRVESASVGALQRWQALEFFAGIGGFCAAWPEVSVRQAFDISREAEVTYRKNFLHPYHVGEISSLSDEQLGSLDANLWWMSPPCQPFSRRGHRRDIEDSRTRPFLRLIDAIQTIRPKAIALENVIGFQGSQTHRSLTSSLDRCGYQWVEREICPSQFGWPNRRPRFYMLALHDSFSATITAWQPFPNYTRPLCDFTVEQIVGQASEQASEQNSCQISATNASNANPISHAVAESLVLESLVLDAESASRYRAGLSRIDPQNPETTTACFASSYGKTILHAGSYLEVGSELRRFSPREVARLLGFRDSFQLDHLQCRRAWKLLGNSLSIPAVRYVLSHLPGGPKIPEIWDV